jgi:hypothetical protein
MPIRPLNSIAGFSVGDPAVTVVQANGDVNTINFTANGLVNLGNVGNLKILGGNTGQFLQTDGSGNLIWDNVGNISSNRAAPMPYLITTGESYIINENFQGLYTQPITIDGELVVDGILVEIQDSIQSDPTQILFDTNGTATGNTGFTFLNYNGNLNVPGNINVNGSIIPDIDDTYDLGRANARWRNGYFGGNTLYLDEASISVNEEGYVVITNVLGGQFIVEGNTTSGTNEIENGNSNVLVYPNGNVAFTISGTSNVMVVTTTGANLTGNLTTGGVKTDNLYYANGTAWNFGQDPGGTNTQIQFNNDGNFDASANLTYNKTNNLLTLIGTANISDLNVSGNTVVDGNLTVNGNLIYINVTELSIKDPIINLQTGANGTPPLSNSGKDVGSALNYYDTEARIAFMGWDTSNSEFAFGSQTSISSEIVTFNTFGNVRAQTFKGNVEATTIAGNLTTATQSNITTVGTLGSLVVTGNITAGNVSGGNVVNANYLVSNSGCVSINGAFIAVDSTTGGIFNSSINDINIGLAANIVMGSTSGTITARGNLIANNISTTGNLSANLITGTLTTAAQANITTVGTLGNLSVTGNATANIVNANTTITQGVVSKRTPIPTSILTVVDSFSTSAYRTAKYVVSSQNDNGFESLEVLLIHNDINSYITVYAAINDGGGNTVTFSTGINSGNVELRATGLDSNTVINLIGTYVPN